MKHYAMRVLRLLLKMTQMFVTLVLLILLTSTVLMSFVMWYVLVVSSWFVALLGRNFPTKK